MDFSKFDKVVNAKDLEKARQEALENTYEEIPAGKYVTKIEDMKIGETKDGRPMFKVQMRIVEGGEDTTRAFVSKFKNKKPCIFMNRVMFGTKNDANMIASVEGWLAKIFPDDPILFESYTDFSEQVLDAAEDCEGLLFAVYYDPNQFNSIQINEVFES